MFEPRIVAFLCTWCSYTGADTAGINRLKIPSNLLAVRIPCSGRVSPELVMRAFDEGADGVLVLGCHIGECHYDNGNHRAAKRLPLLNSLLAFAGLEPERLRLDWVSASEGERFARITSEFTAKVRELGPIHWKAVEPFKVASPVLEIRIERTPLLVEDYSPKVEAIRAKAHELLEKGEVSCVIGYEMDRRGRTRPAFIHSPAAVERLTWNADCSHNLTRYLRDELPPTNPARGEEKPVRVAVVVKPCDSKAVNVLLAENQLKREAVYVIGVGCNGMQKPGGDMQARCETCRESTPVVADVVIGAEEQSPQRERSREEPGTMSNPKDELVTLDNATTSERMEFWLSQFDRCIRCYACRQACPMCNCPTCLYERDDSVYLGPRIGLNEKRTFHLGRAYHLAGRCVGCDECERACPVGLPIGLLNRKIAAELEQTLGFRAGLAATPSPIVTVLSGEYKED